MRRSPAPDTVRLVIVLGAGVSGLTTAVVLAEAGQRVEVLAQSLPPHTTSNVAAAFWYPYGTLPSARTGRWSVQAYRRFADLCDVPRAAVRMRRAFDVSRTPMERPWWGDAVRDLTPLRASECPPGFEHGWAFDAPVIDTRAYLPYLIDRLRAAGGTIAVRTVGAFDELDPDEVILNCCGLGSKTLCNDDALHPIRGQLVHVDNPGLDAVLLDEQDGGGIAYAVPRGDQVVLGGTAAPHDDELAPRSDEAEAIIGRCAGLDPRLGTARRQQVVVGLRPGRHDVRLELEQDGPRQIVHNYGHGGAGVTLSWGCALDVLALLDRAGTT